MRTKVLVIAILLLLLAGFVALSATFAPSAARVAIPPPDGTIDYNGVRVNNYTFEPRTLSVKTGTIVTWVNEDPGTVHAVTSETSLFASGNIQATEGFSFTFSEPGSYKYFCAIHPWMNGTVIVSDQSG